MEHSSVLRDSDPSFVVPSALQNNAWQIWLACLGYLLTSFFALLEAWRAYSRKQTPRSYRFMLLICSFLFCFLRGMFSLIFIPTWEQHMFFLYLVSYFLPLYLQYWIFSLLVLFVIKLVLVMHGQESHLQSRLYPTFALIQLSLLLSCVVASYVLSQKWSEKPVETRLAQWDQEASIFNMVVYSLLTVLGGYYCYRGYTILSPLALLPDSPSLHRNYRIRYLVIILLFFTIFACRTLWCILYYTDVNPLMSMISGWIRESNKDSFNTAYLLFYSVFEIFPTLLVVLAFRTPASRSALNSHDEYTDDPAAVRPHTDSATPVSSGYRSASQDLGYPSASTNVLNGLTWNASAVESLIPQPKDEDIETLHLT
eukprot:TRINITY_DN19505_c0_g1_i4.p1 TRINITY_DN19505_c0_g1~~TRINITY_DN19505_c0_g1_i4.p1  ORF type:complete len:369 (+),score=69.58 TRINITY_DN19505_c0_g1_i4:116-1222(+)